MPIKSGKIIINITRKTLMNNPLTPCNPRTVNGDKKLTIAFNQQGVKMLMLSMAKLEIL